MLPGSKTMYIVNSTKTLCNKTYDDATAKYETKKTRGGLDVHIEVTKPRTKVLREYTLSPRESVACRAMPACT